MSSYRSMTEGTWVVRESPCTLGDYDVVKEQVLTSGVDSDMAYKLARLANQRDALAAALAGIINDIDGNGDPARILRRQRAVDALRAVEAKT